MLLYMTLRCQDWQPAGLLSLWNSPGKNTGVSGHFLLQGNLPDPGIESGSLALQVDSLLSEPPTSHLLTPNLDFLLLFHALWPKTTVN